MNEVKRSLEAAAGNVSGDKEEVKHRILSGRREPKRRNPFPFVATAIVLAAVMFFAFNIFTGEFSDKQSGAYEIDETYYDLLLLNEGLEHPPGSIMRYNLLLQVLYADSLIEYAKTKGYKEDAKAIEEEAKEQQQTFYDGFSAEELQSLEQSQLETFGYTYNEYFEHIIPQTIRYNQAVNWLVKHPPENMTTHREVLDSFMQEHDKEIVSFMKKKQITTPSTDTNYVDWEVLVTSVEEDTVSAVYDLDPELVNSMSPEQLEASNQFARFKVAGSVEQIKPFSTVTITYDPLSYPIEQAEQSKFFQDVTGWK
ncbi:MULTISPECIES: hypothetical protein [Sporosarcina]|uniref:hypothetical protein n=1 Tax=Sporosarcina TaxID=1569 RepID=UPI00129B30B5|nr:MULTISPECIES: hypothetical protein [Sporosarcina]GKV66968.1 hypothetical protein NCCP2331_31210 [Sporosarcina sp. NCCP-2331]GLB57275.1 hypothetical protein NCCP2378_30630 [Sporosarcina sp. NCCP-2378]